MARAIDGRLPPVQLSSESDTRAFFGPAGTVIFEGEEGHAKYLFRMREDGSSRRKVTAESIISLLASHRTGDGPSSGPGSGDGARPMVAYPLDGGDPVRLCENCSIVDGGQRAATTPPILAWSPDGQYAYFSFQLGTEATV